MNIQLTYHRRQTTATHVGNLFIGSEYPVRIQTMANTSTNDIEGSVAQAERCIAADVRLKIEAIFLISSKASLISLLITNPITFLLL